MKKIILSTLLIFVGIVSYAQNWNSWSNWGGNPEKEIIQHKTRYQGEINVSYVFGTGSNPYNRIGVETVHGARLNPFVFCGVGVGVNHFYGQIEETYWGSYRPGAATFVPVFAAFRFYFINRRVSPYLKIDVGYGIGNNGRLYASPSIGLKYSFLSHMAINFDIGFQIQQINQYGSADTFGGILFKLGWSF